MEYWILLSYLSCTMEVFYHLEVSPFLSAEQRSRGFVLPIFEVAVPLSFL